MPLIADDDFGVEENMDGSESSDGCNVPWEDLD